MLEFEILARGLYRPEQVDITYDPSLRIAITPSVQQWMDALWQRKLAIARESHTRLFDSQLFRLVQASSATDGTLRLTLGNTSYKEYVTTREPEFASEHTREELSNALGVCSVVETSDGYILLDKREGVDTYVGRYHVIGGFFERDLDHAVGTDVSRPPFPHDHTVGTDVSRPPFPHDHTVGADVSRPPICPLEPMGDADAVHRPLPQASQPDPFAAISREIREETGIQAADIREQYCLGVVYDLTLPHCELCFLTRLSISLQEVHTRVPEEDEIQHLHILHVTAESLRDFILAHHSNISPTGEPNLLMYGAGRYGEEWWNEVMERIS